MIKGLRSYRIFFDLTFLCNNLYGHLIMLVYSLLCTLLLGLEKTFFISSNNCKKKSCWLYLLTNSCIGWLHNIWLRVGHRVLSRSERKRTQRTQRSFEKNVKERENVSFFCKRTQNVTFFFQYLYIDMYI